MPALQVKDFPEDLYEELRQTAAEDCRSVSQQTVYILREYLRYRDAFEAVKHAKWALPLATDLLPASEEAERRARAERRRKVFERIHERGPIEAPEGLPDAAELVRSMRDERTDQIIEACGGLQAMAEGE